MKTESGMYQYNIANANVRSKSVRLLCSYYLTGIWTRRSTVGTTLTARYLHTVLRSKNKE